MSYYLFEIAYYHGEFKYTEHYVIQADSEAEADELVFNGLHTWYQSDLASDETGLFDNGDNEYEGGVVCEVNEDFVKQLPEAMKLFDFGRQ